MQNKVFIFETLHVIEPANDTLPSADDITSSWLVVGWCGKQIKLKPRGDKDEKLVCCWLLLEA